MIQHICGDSLQELRKLPAESVQCCVTSPPYWGLRDYGIDPTSWPEITYAPMAGLPEVTIPPMEAIHGLEPDPLSYVGHAVSIFREVLRVLRGDGVLWLNLGDCYATGAGKVGACPGGSEQGKGWRGDRPPSGKHAYINPQEEQRPKGPHTQPNRMPQKGLKPKDLTGIPWRVALALQADGWYLRSDIIWHKPNPMPESVRDRPTKAHEYIFLLSKSEHYFYDAAAIKEPCSDNTNARGENVNLPNGWHNAGNYHGATPGRSNGVGWGYATEEKPRTKGRKTAQNGSGIKNNASMDAALVTMPETRNKRSVWTVTTQGFAEAHFATFPPALIRPCILAGSNSGDTILDVFGGSGTTGMVAEEYGRNSILIDINPNYIELQKARCNVTPGLPL